ncbi:PfkB family carbohydrate kinase [Muricoccus vinaceus]|uniref:PfkB family carbohydrate kinase n=1 Tax=Muricoccus vinaceus TaxID=424704 RepID=A0ABV6IVY4_9PROT
MSGILVAGGVYRERCIWPNWQQTFGSAGRAACALADFGLPVTLVSCASPAVETEFAPQARISKVEFRPTPATDSILFDYVHSMSIPRIWPDPARIKQEPTLQASSEIVLRFGMIESTVVVDAQTCVYDPQSAFRPEPFVENGSRAQRLAIVANRSEVRGLGRDGDAMTAARRLLADTGAEVVVMKSGTDGALVVTAGCEELVPAYQTERVWTVGSGDVFAAAFTAWWGEKGLPPAEAAHLASRATADYVASMALPINARLPDVPETRRKVVGHGARVYLAAPFFNLGQRWLVDEARRCLRELGMDVFSPVHDVGHGPAEQVAPEDLRALRDCDLVFALLDGLDSGTVFEAGYARAIGKPVYALAQSTRGEDLKMVTGSGCQVYEDLVTALHHMHWRA